MKLLLLAAAALCLVAHAQGSALPNQKDSKDLVRMLKSLLEKVEAKKAASGEDDDEDSGSEESGSEESSEESGSEESGSGRGGPDPYEILNEVDQFLRENAEDILQTPAYKVPEERLETLLSGVTGIMSAHIAPDMGATVALRLITAMVEHTLESTLEKIWGIADSITSAIRDTEQMTEASNGKKRSLAMEKIQEKKELAKASAMNTLAMKMEEMIKKGFAAKSGIKVHIARSASGNGSSMTSAESSESSGSGSYPEYRYDHYDAIWEHIAGPAYGAIYRLSEITREGDHWMNVYYEVQYLAEDEGILQANVHDALFAFAYTLGATLYAEPREFPGDDVWAEVVPLLHGIVDVMENFDGTTLPEVEMLTDDDKALFAQVYLAVGPLIREAAKPLAGLVTGLTSGDVTAMEAAFVDYLGRVFGRQLYILSNLDNIIRENMPKKAAALATIKQGLRDGKQDDILVAIFTKVAEAGMSQGERIENMIHFFGDVLDHVAFTLDPSAGQKGNYGLGFSGTSGGRSGGQKRWMKV